MCRESETIASATLGRSQDVCEGAQFLVECEGCVVRSCSLFIRPEINDEEEETQSDAHRGK